MASSFSRSVVLVYGIVSYLIGVAGIACIILALAKLIPFGFLYSGETSIPVVWNLVLVALWGLSHSGMARRGFKNWITKFIPEPAERSTYVLVSGVVSILLVGLWQEVPGVLWSIDNQAAVVLLWTLFGFGWVYLLAATFAINHFDLFGLRQVFINFKDQPRTPLKFVKTAMYRTTRHPIQTGVLIGIWATPEMTATQLVLSIGFTIYIFVGLWFEERDSIRDIGEPYEQYKQETGKVLPKLFGRK
jgi:protein-S-isoprenylcysteine O-methyltransferase Ste14